MAMINLFVSASTETFATLNLVLLFGIVVLAGTVAERLFQKLHIPQVVGCIFIGILLGNSVFNLVTIKTIEALKPFTMFTLGIIGFMIGGELRREVFKKYGKQFFIILFSQGFGAFLLVMIGVTLLMYSFNNTWNISISTGLVLGAIASATAPAATVNVLWEYKTRGPLTAAILAIVALDDGLALLLYRAAATGAQTLTGANDVSVLTTTSLLLGEILGSILLGFMVGVGLYYLLKFVRADDKILAFSISSLLIVVGVSMIFDIDPILPAMTLGITIANTARRQSKSLFELISKFTPPIYISFFVLAGAHMEFGNITAWMVIMIGVYVVCRVIGKVAGAWFGANYSNAPVVVRKYLGICLLPQAGVAIGLAILAGQQFEPEFGKTIIMVVMTATFIMEILGPIFVKAGVKKAGEIGMNVTEEDLIKSYVVGDVMDSNPVTITEDKPLPEILEVFSTTESIYYPVTDNQSNVIGKITISGIKEMFANQDAASWLLACDVAEPLQDKTTSQIQLEDVMEKMRRYDLENISVVQGPDSNKLVGVLDYHKVNRRISAEVLRRRKAADGMQP